MSWIRKYRNGCPSAPVLPAGLRQVCRASGLVVLCLLLAACASALVTPTQPPSSVTESPSASPQPPATLGALSTPTAQPAPPTLTLYLPSDLPAELVSSLPLSISLASEPASASYALAISPAAPLMRWVYALAAPFPTILDGVSIDALQAAWRGQTPGGMSGSPLLLSEQTLAVLSAWWGEPAAGAVQVLPEGGLLDYAWAHQPAWAIVPFEALEPRWKVLAVDGQSPIRNDFDPLAYPLSLPVGLLDASGLPLSQLPPELRLPASNRDASRLTVLDLTGVTALVRATAFTMEGYGITYPAGDIGQLLASADLTHISNEIPFNPDCPFPEPMTTRLVFCSNPAYMALLEAVGTDLVELSGDHFADYGPEATYYTLDLYRQHNLPTYGGGANATEARQPLLIEDHGNRLAFLGCNIGCEVKTETPCDAVASDDRPGANRCDFVQLGDDIRHLTSSGYQVIVTLQHKEYYTDTAQPLLVHDFGLLADAGAVIVSGSQAHQPQGFAFQNGSFIHYGLGNLFFDQWHFCARWACDNSFIDRHTFYNGRYISTELVTLRFIDSARPRLMTPEERQDFLRLIFAVSRW